MAEHWDDPDVRAGRLHHDLEAAIDNANSELSSILFSMYDLIGEGCSLYLDEAKMINAQNKLQKPMSQLNFLRDYLRANRLDA